MRTTFSSTTRRYARLIRARCRTRQCLLTVFVAFAPHNSHTERLQKSFWSALSCDLGRVPRHDMTLAIGDLNANTGGSPLGVGSFPVERNALGEAHVDYVGVMTWSSQILSTSTHRGNATRSVATLRTQHRSSSTTSSSIIAMTFL